MGLDYHIYKPREKLELSKAIDLIESLYLNSIKTKYSEYFLEFSLSNIEKYHSLRLNQNSFHFYSSEFSCKTEDYISTLENINLYSNCYIRSKRYSEDSELGFSLQIDNENLELILDIELPYADLNESKKLLSELIRFLNAEGIYLGLSDYDKIEEYVNQLINLNSSVKPSFTWQLNISNYSFSHSNGYAINSKYNPNDNKSYRMTGIRIGFPKHYFKHKNIDERNKINNYSARLILALSKYYKRSSRIQFTSKNLELLKSCKSSNKDGFRLSSKIDLTEYVIEIKESLLHELFEAGYNEYTLSEIKLNKEQEFNCKISLIKEESEDIKLFVYSNYAIDKEEVRRKQIEKVLNIELEYFGAE